MKVLRDSAGWEHPVDREVEAYLGSLDESEVRMLALELATTTAEGRRIVQARAALAAGDMDGLATQFVDRVTQELDVAGFLPYEEAGGVAAAAEEVLRELEEQFDDAGPDVIGPALLKATVLLRRLTEQSDDSDGGLGLACQSAVDLYARACREGHPDAVEVALWLAGFRASSPGWPVVSLDDFVDAFDEEALGAYRNAVAELATGSSARNDGEVRAMQLELADRDGDVDLAIRLLHRDEHPNYAGIIDRLRDAGRGSEVLGWVDKAVDAGHVRASSSSPYWLNASEVSAAYLEAGRTDDALVALRDVFRRAPGVAAYRVLCGVAERLGRADDERAWALGHTKAEVHRNRRGALLVRLALADDDLDRAWLAADSEGPGDAWRELAEASATTHPRRAADLYRPTLQAELAVPNTRRYPGIAPTLATIRTLYHAAGRGIDIDAEIRTLREQYARRPALLRELDRRGLR